MNTSLNNHHSPRQERKFARILYIGLGFIVLVCFVVMLFRTQSKPTPSTTSPVDVHQELENKDLSTTTTGSPNTEQAPAPTTDRPGDTPVQAPDHK